VNILKSRVEVDDFTRYASKSFDFDFTGESFFTPWEKPNIPKDFSIGVIHGASGSGKSTLMDEFGKEEDISWDEDRAIVSHFEDPKDAVERLTAVGLGSVPSWMKPYHVLSNGEQFRADMARKLKDGAVIDEFTSVVNRSVAKSASVAISKYVKRNGLKKIVLVTCHDDVLDWLEPDWSFDCNTGELSVGRCLHRPSIRLEIFESNYQLWETFKKHHYLSSDINNSSTCFKAVWEGECIGFSASLALPGKIPPLYDGDTRNKYKESRTVIMPDYQGLGIGVRFSDAIAQHWLDKGYRYFSKTAHIRMGEYRQEKDWWRPTSTNLVDRGKSTNRTMAHAEYNHFPLDRKRICYSHEYVGKVGDKHRDLYELRLKGEK